MLIRFNYFNCFSIFMFSFLQDFQKDIIRAIEALDVINSKHVEVGKSFLHISLYDSRDKFLRD